MADFVGMSEAEKYRLFQRCAVSESDEIMELIRQSVPRGEPPVLVSVLDIGAGNGMFLERADFNISRYVGFESDKDLFDELKLTCERLGGDEHMCLNEHFGIHTDPQEFGPVDIVLMSHCLYNVKAKTELIDHALRFLKDRGVLLLVHRWNHGNTCEAIKDHFSSKNRFCRLKVWETTISLSSTNSIERKVIAGYTGIPLTDLLTSNEVQHAIACIGVENGCWIRDNHKLRTIAALKDRVNPLARNKDPYAVVTPATLTGVAAVVQGVARGDIACSGISCVGGGHSSNCLGQDALAVDLSLFKYVRVHADKRCVSFGSGTTIGTITKACQDHGLFVPLGDRPGVGVGLVLQGGLNHFMRLFGLATDGICSLTYVDPSGQVMHAETSDELFQFRGAGTNFGVVVEIVLRCYLLLGIQSQDILYRKPTSLPEILQKYSDLAISLDAEKSLDGFMFWTSQSDLSFATSSFIYMNVKGTSEGNEGHYLTEQGELISFGENLLPTALYDRELYMSELFTPEKTVTRQETAPTKIHSKKICLFFTQLRNVSELFYKLLQNAPTKWCYVHFLHGGSRTCSSTQSSAFGCREWNFAAVITGRWSYESLQCKTSVIQWLSLCCKTLLEFAQGMYSADIEPSETEYASLAFGNTLFELAKRKRQIDPRNIFRHGCQLLGSTTGLDNVNDPQVSDRSVLIAICGRRCSGKDWLAEQIAIALRHQGRGINAAVTSISDGIKDAYARMHPDVDRERLFEDRVYKEAHREKLAAFYSDQKKRHPFFDEQCMVKCLDESPKGSVLILTGLRNGLKELRNLAGRPVLMIKVEASDTMKQSRAAWVPTVYDESSGERAVDEYDAWDMVYKNDDCSTTESVGAFVWERLVPLMFRSMVRLLPNTPSPLVTYKDVPGGPLLYPFFLKLWTCLVEQWLSNITFDVICCPESLGFVFAAPVAAMLDKPIVLIRKVGKLPGMVVRTEYAGSNISNLTADGHSNSGGMLEISRWAICSGQKIVFIDDCLASGSTFQCAETLINKAGGQVVAVVIFMKLIDCLREQVKPITFHAVQYEGP